MDSIDPKILINMIEFFENERHRSMLIQKTLDGLRAETIDIRMFPLGQLAKFIEYVVLYQPKDVKVFFNYVVTAFDTGFFKL